MARARNIKPGLFSNEILGAADPLYTLLFEGLWLLADRDGRLENRPLRIKAFVFPYREGLDIIAMLGWLEEAGFIRRYQCSGLALIQILNFGKHQNPHKNEPESIYAPPDEIGTTSEKIGSTRADSGFRIPDPGLRITQPPTAAPTPAPTSAPKAKKPAKTSLPEGFVVSSRVQAWADERGYGHLEQHLEAFQRKARARSYEYANWDDAFMEAIREDWANLRGKGINGAAPPPESAPSALAAADAGAALAKINADREKAVPMPGHIRAQIADALKGKVH